MLELLLFVALGSSEAKMQDDVGPLAKAASNYAKIGEHKVHYKSLGTGATALVLVHGWSCDMSFWKQQVPALAGKIRIVLIDLPGHGKSDRPKIDYTMDLFARAVEAVLADAKVEHAIVAGHSMGTPVARQYYRLYPKKTKALIVVDGALRSLKPDAKAVDKFLAPFEGDGFHQALAKFVDTMFKKDTPAEVRTAVHNKIKEASQHVAISAMRNVFDPKIWKDDKIEVPVLCLMAKSAFYDEKYEKSVRELAPKVDYRVMESVGHFLMMEQPRTFNRHLLEFLEKQGFVEKSGD